MKKFETTSVQKAYELLGRERIVIPAIPGAEETVNRLQSQLDLETFIESINKESNNGANWVPDYTNVNERKYEPWFWIKKSETNPSGFVFSRTTYGFTLTSAGCGSRFAFHSVDAWHHTIETQEALDLFLITWTKKP